MSRPSPRCAIVVPCYNEAKRLPRESFLRFAEAHQDIFFVFVNDGSRDQTSSVLQSLVAAMPTQAKLLDNAHNQGKAEVVRQGLLWALDASDAEFVGFWDADLATPLPTILEMLEVLAERPALWMTFGARVQLLGRHIERKSYRHYLGRVFATVASLMLKLAVYDTQCGAKIFRRNAYTRSLFAESFVSRWIFDVEIIARFLSLPSSSRPPAETAIFELPLREWRDIDGSKVKPHDFFKALRDLLLIRSRYSL